MSASTSCRARAERLLRQILDGQPPDTALARALARDDCSEALFGVVVEGLADRFERRLCDAYADLFTGVIAEFFPEIDASALRKRYERVRRLRHCSLDPKRVFVLSRVTLGADIAVTGVLLDAAKRRFPRAAIALVGSGKSAELWAADPRIEHVPAPYPRTGSLRDRLAASFALREPFDADGIAVFDPDSRLTQLGLAPVCREEAYFFFESRSYGGDTGRALPELASEWCRETLGVSGASPYLALRERAAPSHGTRVAVSFGVGENAAKSVGQNFESGLLRELSNVFDTIAIDAGAGGEEADRVHRALQESGVAAEVWRGSFAGFAAQIAASDVYFGYDSAGQHAAAALGIPLVTLFRGQVSPRMFKRWRPTGLGPIAVVDGNGFRAETALARTMEAVKTVRKL